MNRWRLRGDTGYARRLYTVPGGRVIPAVKFDAHERGARPRGPGIAFLYRSIRNAPIPIAGHVLRKGFRPKSRFCACAERWPELRFEMTTGYLDFVET